MKIIYLFTFLFIILCTNAADVEIIDGSVIAHSITGNPSYVTFNPLTKIFTTNRLDVFTTYPVGINTFELSTDKGQSANLLLANNSIIKIMPESDFRIDSFNINVKNVQQYPVKVESESYNLNLAITKGEVFFITQATNAFDLLILQTPVSNIGLGNGIYHVTVETNTVIIYILDGYLDVYDNVTNKKENVKEGNVVLIHPPPKLSTKRANTFSDKMITSVKKSSSNDSDPLLKSIENITNIHEEILFACINSNIIAIKIK